MKCRRMTLLKASKRGKLKLHPIDRGLPKRGKLKPQSGADEGGKGWWPTGGWGARCSASRKSPMWGLERRERFLWYSLDMLTWYMRRSTFTSQVAEVDAKWYAMSLNARHENVKNSCLVNIRMVCVLGGWLFAWKVAHRLLDSWTWTTDEIAHLTDRGVEVWCQQRVRQSIVRRLHLTGAKIAQSKSLSKHTHMRSNFEEIVARASTVKTDLNSDNRFKSYDLKKSELNAHEIAPQLELKEHCSVLL